MAVEVLVTAVLEVMVVVGASVDDVDISLVDEGTVELGPDVAEAVLPLSVVVELVVAVMAILKAGATFSVIGMYFTAWLLPCLYSHRSRVSAD